LLNKKELRYFLGVNSFIVLFVAIIAFLYLREIQAYRIISLFVVIAFFTVFLNLLLILLLSRRPAVSFWVSVIAFDIVVAVMSIATGGIDSRIPYLFVLPVAFAVYFQGVRGGIIQSAVALILVYGLTQFEYRLPGEYFTLFPSPLTKNLTYFLVYMVVFAFFTAATAYFSGIIRRQERDFLKFKLSSEEVLNTVPSGILTISPDNRVLFSNRSATELLKGQELEEFLRILPSAQGSVRSEIKIGDRILGYSQKVLEDGTKTVVFQDLTEVKRLEDERKELEKLAFLGELAGNLAHEIRNPVQAINMAMELLLSRRVNPDDEFLRSVLYDAERLSQIVNRFLHYAKIPEVVMEEVELHGLVEKVFLNTIKLFTEKVDLKNSIPEDFKLKLDPVRMEELFSNLFRNSLEARTRGLIEVNLLKPGEEFILIDGARYMAPGFSIIVRDYGEGMDRETTKRAKELFFSNRKEGTGFGLAVCDRIMKVHGGNLKIFSVKDKGTDVVLEFSTYGV